jgi:hypothetical protein
MKVKDYKGNMGGVRIKTTNGVVGIWKSQWGKGVWLEDGKTTRIYPQFVNSLSDTLEWDITEEDINCDQLTDFNSIDNEPGS